MKVIKFTLAMLLYFVVLSIVYWTHIRYFKVNVVFYSAILDAFIAAAIASGLLFSLKTFRMLDGFEKFLTILIWVLVGYAFAISVPTVIDRSLSFYILEKIQQRGGGIKLDAFEQVFANEYMREHRLVDVRLTEQLESGTIKIDNGCVRLTDKGDLIASFGRYYRQNWLPKERLLMGKYTDALTDPFRHSVEKKGDECR